MPEVPAHVSLASRDYAPTPTPPGDDVLPGTIIDWGGPNVPALYLLCNGAAVSRATYALLFAAIEDKWGPGDGVTTFNVPNLLGRATIGDGTGAGLSARVLGQAVGEEAHTLTTPELPNHNHGVNDPGHAHSVPTITDTIVNTAGDVSFSRSANSDSTHTLDADGNTTGITTLGTGADTPHNNMQPSAVVRKLIYAGA